MRKSIKTEAIVLRKRSLPNQDKIITFLTKETGKISVLAKGIKKITSRRLPHVQTANLVNIVLSDRGGRYYLVESTLVSGFSQIKKDQNKLQDLYLYLFVLERLLPEGQTEPYVYGSTIKFMISLSSNKNKEDLILNSLNELLQNLGYINESKSYDELVWTIEGLIHEKLPTLN